jgi:predicted DCC family thiol-disulfide oxidoreductase YuxK
MNSEKSNIYPLTLFIDSECALCRAEEVNLQRLDSEQHLKFVDIHGELFQQYQIDKTTALAEIHAQCADGTIIKGVEVFRLAYAATDYGWLLSPTGWRPLKPLFNLLYQLFARHREFFSRWIGAPIEGLVARWALKKSQTCHRGYCERPPK